MSTLLVPATMQRGSSLVVSERGEPIPPAGVQEALAGVDPRYHLRWVGHPSPYWAVAEYWRETDPRQRLLAEGKVRRDGAWDILMMLPPDCSAEQACALLSRKLERVINPRKMADQAHEALTKHNDAVRDGHVSAVRTELAEEAERMTPHEARVLGGHEAAHPAIVVPQSAPIAKSARGKKKG